MSDDVLPFRELLAQLRGEADEPIFGFAGSRVEPREIFVINVDAIHVLFYPASDKVGSRNGVIAGRYVGTKS